MTTPTGVLFYDPRPKPLATNGTFQPGAYYLFYLTGTTTPTNVYADGLLATPLSQTPGANQPSCTADSSGRFNPIYLNPATIYRVQLYNSIGVLQEDTDPFVPAPALTGFVTTAALASALTAYATTAAVNSALAGYETVAAAALLAPLASPPLTGTPTAPTPAAGNSSTQIATTAFITGQASLSSPGYQVFPSGLIMQWGTQSGGGSGPVAVVFPKVFPNACFVVTGQAITVQGTVVLSAITATGFTVTNGASGSSTTWIALGF